MKSPALFALVAMIPAAFNPVPARAGGAGIVVALCSGAETGRTVTIPVKPQLPPAQDGNGCCAKGCHSSSSRKRGQCRG